MVNEQDARVATPEGVCESLIFQTRVVFFLENAEILAVEPRDSAFCGYP
jgi:hypothetical protein